MESLIVNGLNDMYGSYTQPNGTTIVDKIKSFKSDRRKIVVLIFIVFSIVVALVTLSSELEKEKVANITPTPHTPSPTPAEPDSPLVNSTVKEVDTANNVYQNKLFGFSFEYPKDVGLVREGGLGSPSASTIYITIENLTGPTTQDVSGFLRDRELLNSGDFGLEDLKVKYYQKGVIKVGQTNVKMFTNLQNEDCLSVALTRSAIFYRFDRRITIILKGPHPRLIKDHPGYYARGEGGCSRQPVWSAIGAESFMATIPSKTAPDYILKWQNDFAYLISTLKITTPTDPALFEGSVKGRWQGDNMVVSIVGNNKLGKITDMKLWYSDTESGDWEPFATFKMVPSQNKIRIKFRDQYGNLSPVYKANVEFK